MMIVDVAAVAIIVHQHRQYERERERERERECVCECVEMDSQRRSSKSDSRISNKGTFPRNIDDAFQQRVSC